MGGAILCCLTWACCLLVVSLRKILEQAPKKLMLLLWRAPPRG